MEYLNLEQKKVLAERDPKYNKTKFPERVSKVIITKNTDWALVVKLNDMGIDAQLIEKDKGW